MHPATLLLLASSALASPYLDAILSGRQTNNEEAYLQEVCFPNTTDPVPPCQEIINIQSECPTGNTTETLGLEAHAQCICGGSFFEDWIGCLDCDYVHGARSPLEVNAFNAIITSASHLLCTGTPTAGFAALFSSLSDGGASASGATVLSDQFPSQTAVSLYFTATQSQGPGTVTGSATAATAMSTGTGSQSTSSGGGAVGATTVLSGKSTSSTVSGSQSSSTSSAGAAPTGGWMGVAGAIAGGAVVIML